MNNTKGFITRPGGDGERIIRRARLRNVFQPPHVFGSLIIVMGLICAIFGPSIIDSVRTAQVVAYAEAETGMSLSVDEKGFGYSEARVKLASDEECGKIVNHSEGGTSLRSQAKLEGGCSVVVHKQDAVWGFVKSDPLSHILILRAVVVAAFLLIGLFIIGCGRPFDLSAVVSNHPNEIADRKILSDYVIGEGVSDQSIWDAAAKEREAKELGSFADAVEHASYTVAATKRQKKDGDAARIKSERLRSEVAQMLSGEPTTATS